jgi:hypothetical protein
MMASLRRFLGMLEEWMVLGRRGEDGGVVDVVARVQ